MEFIGNGNEESRALLVSQLRFLAEGIEDGSVTTRRLREECELKEVRDRLDRVVKMARTGSVELQLSYLDTRLAMD